LKGKRLSDYLARPDAKLHPPSTVAKSTGPYGSTYYKYNTDSTPIASGISYSDYLQAKLDAKRLTDKLARLELEAKIDRYYYYYTPSYYYRNSLYWPYSSYYYSKYADLPLSSYYYYKYTDLPLSTYRSLYYSDYLDYKLKLDLIDLKYKNYYYNRYLDTYVPYTSYASRYLPLSYYYDYPSSYYYYYNKYYYYPTSYARYLDTVADIKYTAAVVAKRRFYDDEYVRYNAYSKYVDAKYEKLSLENKRKEAIASAKKSYYDDNFVSGYETPVKRSGNNYSNYDNNSTNYTSSKRSDPTYSSPHVAYLKSKYFGGESSCSKYNWVNV